MALIMEGMCCPLCGKALDIESELFATSGTFFPPDHPLFRYCDAAMHPECFEAWPHRREFMRGYFEMCVAGEKESPSWGAALQTDEVLVTVNPTPPVAQVEVMLAEAGADFRVPLAEWGEWIKHEEPPPSDLLPMESEALGKVWPLLRKRLPTADDLVRNVDWSAKQALRHRQEEERRLAEEARLTKTRLHNKACRVALRRGVACPYCGADEGIRFLDNSPEKKSYFICDACGRSFGPADVTVRFRLEDVLSELGSTPEDDGGGE